MEERHFVKNDQGFVCAHCGQTVEPLGYTSRNHCPSILCTWTSIRETGRTPAGA